MEYQLILDFTRFLFFQFSLLFIVLIWGRFRSRDLAEAYSRALKDYRISGVLSYLELKTQFGKFSTRSIHRLVEDKSMQGELERSLCTHIYKALELHLKDVEKLKKYSIFKNRIFERLVSLNLSILEFENPSRAIKEMLEVKEKIISQNISVDNTLVVLNTYSKKTYLHVILNQVDRDKLSLLLFSFEKMKNEDLKKNFAKIAFQKIPNLKHYLIEILEESKSSSLRWQAQQYRVQLFKEDLTVRFAN